MDIKKIEAFIAVVDSKSFSKAAEMIGITQPTVSAHISSLEKELNTDLITRTTKEFQITESGKKLYAYGKNIIANKNKIYEELVIKRNQKLKLGVSSAISLGEIAQILKEFNTIYPNVKFEIINSNSIHMLERLSDGLIDICLVGTKSEDFDLNYQRFLDDELVLICKNTDYYKKIIESGLSLEKIKDKAFIMRELTSGTQLELEKLFKKNKIEFKNLNIIASMSDSISIIECVKRGLGIAILSKIATNIYKDDKDLLISSFKDQDMIRHFYIASKKDRYLSDATKNFLDFLKDKYALKK